MQQNQKPRGQRPAETSGAPHPARNKAQRQNNHEPIGSEPEGNTEENKDRKKHEECRRSQSAIKQGNGRRANAQPPEGGARRLKRAGNPNESRHNKAGGEGPTLNPQVEAPEG